MNADIEHIAIADQHRAAAGGAVHGQRHRQVRQRHRRRLPDARSISPRRAPVLLAPAMNTQHAGARGGAAEPARRWRRAASASSSRARAIWPAAGSARAGWPSRPRSSPRPSRDARRRVDVARCAAAQRAGHRRARPTRTSTRCATSATGRAAAWGSRSPRKRAGAARTSRWSPGRPGSSRRPSTTSSACAARPRCTRR